MGHERQVNVKMSCIEESYIAEYIICEFEQAHGFEDGELIDVAIWGDPLSEKTAEKLHEVTKISKKAWLALDKHKHQKSDTVE